MKRYFKSKPLFLAAIILGVCCCTPKGVTETIVNGNKMYVASFNELKSDTVTIALSSLVEDCIFVQLESKEGVYVNPWVCTVTDKYIGIRELASKPYKLFDRSGNFLNNIGTIGRGPGEYPMILWDELIDERNELIYLLPYMGDRVFVYNTGGQFLRDIVAPHQLTMPVMYLSNNILSVIHVSFNEKAIAFQFDANTGELLKELKPPANLTIQQGLGDAVVFSTRNSQSTFDFYPLILKEAYNITSSDTLYRYDWSNNKILPFFTSNYSVTNIYKLHFLLNKDFVITSLHTNPTESGESLMKGIVGTDLKHKKSSFIKVVNDYYGNIPVPIFSENQNINFLKGYWVYTLPPDDLIEVIKNRLAERSCTDNDRQVLQKMLSTLKEGENNVMFIGKLKDEIRTKIF